MKDFSYVMGSHPAYIESLYHDYVRNPDTVDPEWKKFFEGFDFAVTKAGSNGHAAPAAGGVPVSEGQVAKELRVYALVLGYQSRGHLMATTNPIRARKDRKPNLALADFGLGEADFDTEFYAGSLLGLGRAPLRDIIARAQQLYAGDVGIEYTYINDREQREWVETHFREMMDRSLTLERKKRILEKLNEGVIFEKFLHTKYIGQKRFSLEGGESTIAGLDAILTNAANADVKEVVIGMAHRGRLNVLANTLGKTYEQIFSEFEGNMPPDTTMGSGDVKYHLGFRSNIKTPDGKEINVQLTPNPSHLEVVDPVVVGFARAKADVLYEHAYERVLPVLIHGDAAIAGQGVVYELLQMSRLKGYDAGGTIHFVINNQIGFTTDFDDARSTDYCTSVAAMVQAPVLHVNGDDPEAVVKACELAVAYRLRFREDIFVDMVCYRRHGHNEGDDPSFTQPGLYDLIKKHLNPREIYNQKLIARGDVDAALAKEMEEAFWKTLQERLDEVKQHPLPYRLQPPEQAWTKLRHATAEDFGQSPDTGISSDQVAALFEALMTVPEGFTPLRKIRKLLEEKVKLYQEQGQLDWATGELLAYASLLAEGKDVRMSGQDVQRGTFSHRHAILHDEQTNKTYNRLSRVAPGQGEFDIYNSLLSEFAVLGFEYGYSIASPDTLTIWEAQFGDFANGCQTVIDQYLVSSEAKWQKMSGLVLLLPHGYEGQGPEHSSARLERFLQLCADDNIFVTNITTAANLFHALRRQLLLPFRIPLVNMSPKANLRHPRAFSPVADFTSGGFKEVIDDPNISAPAKVKRVLLCSGKIYFDLSEKQLSEKRTDVAIVRLEQLYPLPATQLQALRERYKKAEWVWVQEEPKNMGALSFLKLHLADDFPLRFISRKPMAASATGFSKLHAKEQQEIIERAFGSL